MVSAAHTCTVYVTVLVAIHRYVYVCCSQKTKRLSNLHRVKIQVAIVAVFAFCYSLPRLFEFRVQYPTSNSTSGQPDNLLAESNQTCNDNIGVVEISDIGSSLWFQLVYKNLCFYLVMYVVPLSVLIFVTVRLLATMRVRRRAAAAVDKRSTAVHGRQQARDDSVTVVLVIIIVVFIVCQTPTLFQRLMLAKTGTAALACGQTYFYVEQLADYLVIFNSCVNFGIYVVFAPHFRHILVTDVLGVRRSRRRRGQFDGGTGRIKARTTALLGGALVMSCAGNCVTTAAASSSVADVSCQDGREVCGSSVWSEERSGRAYCSEMAECFALSSPTESLAREHHQPHQQLHGEAGDVILNGVGGISDLPLKPLLSRRD